MKYNEIPRELYAIKNDKTGDVIWNSKGGCYTTYDGVYNRIYQLRDLYPMNSYSVITYRLDRGCDYNGYIK